MLGHLEFIKNAFTRLKSDEQFLGASQIFVFPEIAGIAKKNAQAINGVSSLKMFFILDFSMRILKHKCSILPCSWTKTRPVIRRETGIFLDWYDR